MIATSQSCFFLPIQVDFVNVDLQANILELADYLCHGPWGCMEALGGKLSLWLQRFVGCKLKSRPTTWGNVGMKHDACHMKHDLYESPTDTSRMYQDVYVMMHTVGSFFWIDSMSARRINLKTLWIYEQCAFRRSQDQIDGTSRSKIKNQTLITIASK